MRFGDAACAAFVGAVPHGSSLEGNLQSQPARVVQELAHTRLYQMVALVAFALNSAGPKECIISCVSELMTVMYSAIHIYC